uniref:Uncharacterized protein n=1 Tax=Anguilla anguilla TaxID=7936 RepID=A0A0E9V9K7_ANGAN
MGLRFHIRGQCLNILSYPEATE